MDFSYASETDVAYSILLQKGEPVYYKDLIEEVMKCMGRDMQTIDSYSISEIYTQINIDSRFFFKGNGMWGLSEWNPPELRRSHNAKSSAKREKNRTAQFDEENLSILEEENN